MIKHVHINGDITYADAPWRFEAGTPNIMGMIGLGAALDYLSNLGMKNIAEYENSIMEYAQEQLQKVKSLTLYGNDSRQGVIAFNLGKHHAYDVGLFLIIMVLLSVLGIIVLCQLWIIIRFLQCVAHL